MGFEHIELLGYQAGGSTSLPCTVAMESEEFSSLRTVQPRGHNGLTGRRGVVKETEAWSTHLADVTGDGRQQGVVVLLREGTSIILHSK